MPPKKVGFIDNKIIFKTDLNPGWPIMACAQLKQTGMILALSKGKYLFNLMRGARPHKAAMACPDYNKPDNLGKADT